MAFSDSTGRCFGLFLHLGPRFLYLFDGALEWNLLRLIDRQLAVSLASLIVPRFLHILQVFETLD